MAEVMELGDLGKKKRRVKKRKPVEDDKPVKKRKVRRSKKPSSDETEKPRRRKKSDVAKSKGEGDKKKRTRRTKKQLESDLLKQQSENLGTLGENLINSFSDEQVQDNEQLREYVTMFRTLQDISRAAEKQYFDSKQSRDIYALMQVYNQMRDIIADLRALKDVGQTHEIINKEVLHPFAQSSAAVLLEYHQNLKKAILSNVSKKEDAQELLSVVKDMSGNAGRGLQEVYHEALDKSFQVLSEV